MSTITFSEFTKKYANWETKYYIYKRDSEIYKRIICQWQEGPSLNHEYHACINTTNGNIYLDCRRRKIFAKHLTLALLRPLHTCAKTLWHASIIGPLALEIFKLASGKQTVKDLGKNTLKSLADIIRTPVYGIAMTMVHIGAVVLGVFDPNSLYKNREIAGRLERKMLRVNSINNADAAWLLSPCFSPIKNILKKSGDYFTEEGMEISLKKFAKNQIEFRRNNRVLFNDCFSLYPKEKTYVSSAKTY